MIPTGPIDELQGVFINLTYIYRWYIVHAANLNLVERDRVIIAVTGCAGRTTLLQYMLEYEND
jgi:hypothetical protein